MAILGESILALKTNDQELMNTTLFLFLFVYIYPEIANAFFSCNKAIKFFSHSFIPSAFGNWHLQESAN